MYLGLLYVRSIIQHKTNDWSQCKFLKHVIKSYSLFVYEEVVVEKKQQSNKCQQILQIMRLKILLTNQDNTITC